MGRLGARFEVGEITEAAYRRRLGEIQAEIENLEAASRPRVADPLLRWVRELALRDLSGAWPDARRKDPDGFRSALSQVLQAVHIDMNTKRIVALTPQPAFSGLHCRGHPRLATRAPKLRELPVPAERRLRKAA
jgi:hypothetical protein